MVFVRAKSSEVALSYKGPKLKVEIMPGQRCTVCGNSQNADPGARFHRIPDDPKRRATWLSVFKIKEEDIIKSTRVCCRHFPGGNSFETPDITLGLL